MTLINPDLDLDLDVDETWPDSSEIAVAVSDLSELREVLGSNVVDS